MARKLKKSVTPEEQFQMKVQLENDLSRLMKQDKRLERERGAYTSGAKMAKQVRVMNILEKEQTDVLVDLCVATCSTKKKEDVKVTLDMVTLLHESDFFDSKIKEKRNNLREIEQQIFLVKQNVITARTKVIGDAQYEEKVLAGQKVVECLENKLDTAIKRFCIIQTENSQLREEIDHLLTERVKFKQLWESLIANLDKGKKFMIDIIEQSTIAYNERDELVNKLNALRIRGRADLVLHSEEMLHLQRHKDEYNKLEHFLGTKGQKRIMLDLERKERLRRKQQRDAMEERLIQCKAILAQILEFNKIGRTNDFCVAYAKEEERNFGMFTYITVLQREMEDLTAALVVLHKDIDEQLELKDRRALHQTENLVTLQEQLQQAKKEANACQALLDGTNTQLKKIYTGLGKLSKIVKCSSSPILQLLGDNTTINDYNVLLHLNLLEERIDALILQVYFNQKAMRKKDKVQTLIIKEDVVARPISLINQIVPTNPCPLCVDQELVTCVIDTLQFVQTKEEVEVKLQQRLALPDGAERLHNVSACHLPKSRQIMQRRYQ